MTKRKRPPDDTQIEKFREAARELETDQSEEAFDRIVKRVAKSPPPKADKPPKAPSDR